MKSQIPFLDDLRSELLAHAPDVSTADTPARGKRLRLSGPAVALAAFLLVLVGGALLAWVVAAGDGASFDVVEQPDLIDWDIQITVFTPDDPELLISGVETIVGVVETQYISDLSVLYPDAPPRPDSGVVATTRPADTDTPATTTAERPIAVALLVRLDNNNGVEDIAAQLNQRDDLLRVMYSPEIAVRRGDEYFAAAAQGATVIGRDPLVVQPEPGPEPLFDTSLLGLEIVLIPAEPGDPIMERLQREGGLFRLDDSFQLDETRPILHIGRIDEIDAQHIIYPTAGNSYCDIVVEGDSGAGAGCGDFTNSQYGVASAGSSGIVGHVNINVPTNTSVVALTTDDGQQLWQRPTAGWAIFPARVHDNATYIVDAYDTLGNQTGHWETTH